MTHRPLSPKSLGRARALRRSMTDAERLLWSQLRAHRFESMHFRRQVPIGPYTADFVCHDARLVVEVDGGQHAEDDMRHRDDIRTQWLSGQGYRVLRFWNHEIFNALEGVMDAIHDAVVTPLSSSPPQGGRGHQREGGKAEQNVLNSPLSLRVRKGSDTCMADQDLPDSPPQQGGGSGREGG